MVVAVVAMVVEAAVFMAVAVASTVEAVVFVEDLAGAAALGA